MRVVKLRSKPESNGSPTGDSLNDIEDQQLVLLSLTSCFLQRIGLNRETNHRITPDPINGNIPTALFLEAYLQSKLKDPRLTKSKDPGSCSNPEGISSRPFWS